MVRSILEITTVLLNNISVDSLLYEKSNSICMRYETLENIVLPYMDYYSDTEIKHLLASVYDFLRSDSRFKDTKTDESGIDLFDAIFRIAEMMLVEQENEILCKYSNLLEWRKMITSVSEEIFVAAYFAQQDVRHGNIRHRFTHKTVISHNNKQLKAVLENGMSENHFHLMGSAPYFQVSWIWLMNHILNNETLSRLQQFEKKRRKVNITYNQSYKERSFEDRLRQAFIIRFYLFVRLSDIHMKLDNYQIHTKDIQIGFEQLESVENCVSYTELNEIIKKSLREKYNLKQVRSTHWDKGKYTILELLNMIFGQTKIEEIQFLYPQYYRVMVNMDTVSDSLGWLLRRGLSISIIDIMEHYLAIKDTLDLEVCQPFLEKNVYHQLWQEKTLEYVKNLLTDSERLQFVTIDIQQKIIALKGAKCLEVLDYAYLLSDYECLKDRVQYAELWGERNFLYQCFRQICQCGCLFSSYESNLFHAYLVIKENIRSEMVQANEYVGFENFQIYQDRKGSFLKSTYFEKVMSRMAVGDTLRNQCIISLEARITPAKGAVENYKKIQFYDNAIDKDKELRDKFYYVFHFIKAAEKKSEILSDIKCRSYSHRKLILKYAYGLMNFREIYPRTASRVLGIDAASQEIGCRPEVFAEIFRMLKSHTYAYGLKCEKELLPQLRITYHVGEDFLDIVDGMRAIYEAVVFLGMDCGDRLGHALALGINVESWYNSKKNHLSIPIHDYLDNITWLYHMLIKYSITDSDNLKSYLLSEFSICFKKIYGSSINQSTMDKFLAKIGEKYKNEDSQNDSYYLYNLGHISFDFDIYTYYKAWQLRGDSPELYKNGFFDEEVWSSISAETHRKNQYYPKDYMVRYIPEVAYLYYLYHYSPEVKSIGTQEKEYSVDPLMIRGITAVQKALQKEIAKRGIAIETNPSSNYMIGTFKDYAKHPLLNFYNIGLVANEDILKNCPQIVCSINTDDQGVFSASLENEYALIARALEIQVDKNGNSIYNKTMIYEWLDNIRKNGNRQSFGFQNIVTEK